LLHSLWILCWFLPQGKMLSSGAYAAQPLNDFYHRICDFFQCYFTNHNILMILKLFIYNSTINYPS
jgi:hypothetical protein